VRRRKRCARVVLCHQSAEFASGLGSDATIDGRPAAHWFAQTLSELRARADVTLLARTTAFGYYDDDLVAAVERVTDHLAAPASHLPRQRLWLIRARAVVLASGAIERGIAYGNNDLPGTLLASAARSYVTRYGVRLGQTRGAVHEQRRRLCGGAGAARGRHPGRRHRRFAAGLKRCAARFPRSRVRRACRSCPHRASCARAAACACPAVDVAPRGGGATRRIDCDVLLVSGGCSPAVHLFSQGARHAALRPGDRRIASGCIASSRSRAPAPSTACSISRMQSTTARPRVAGAVGAPDRSGTWPVPQRTVPEEPPRSPTGGAKCFVDLQNDVTVRDIAIAAREGYTLSEHLKRYTTLGMGTDQGKTGSLIGMALLAEHLRVPIADVGTTTFRPPYTPVTLGAVAGQARGAHVEPTRRTPCTRGTPGVARASSMRACGSARTRTRAPVSRRMTPRTARRATCAPTWASSTSRRSARSSCRDAT
jgi:sarcosine oxidase subunit alpha